MWAVTVGSNMARAAPLIGNEGPGQQLLESGGTDLITDTTDARYVLLGASSVGPETLNRFYVLHCVAIPLVTAVLIALHFWRIRKDGGISLPEESLVEKSPPPAEHPTDFSSPPESSHAQ
jgi:quinol-cytochrome oxidoreductase complex cytochrome b subunit